MADENRVELELVATADEQSLKELQKQLEDAIDKSFKDGSKGWIKYLKGTNQAIANLDIGGKFYSAKFGVTKSGLRDKRRKADISGPLTVSQANRLMSVGSEEVYDVTRANIERYNRAKKEELRITREVNEAKEEGYKIDRKVGDTDKTPPKTQISSMGRLLNTFKRVGFYRIARNLFRLAEAGISEGFKGLADISPEVNKTLSSLMTNLQQIANSLVISIYPILKLIEPILNFITQAVMGLAEGISYLAYQLGITSHWFKINRDYLKEFNQQMNKFSFDKFEALSNQSDSGNMFTEMTGTDEEVSKLADAVSAILITLTAIGGLELIKWIKDGGIKTLGSDLKKVDDKIIDIGASLAFAYAIYKIITDIKDLINNWNAKSLADKIKSICKIALYGLGAILIALGTIPALGLPFKIGGIAAIAATAVLDGIGVFANGGMVDSGSLFIAGESGAELVTTMPSGQTGVTNVAQFKQAMLEALYEWGGGFGDGGSVVLNLDGAEVARSRRFTEEMNRRNAGLNLR